MENNPEIEYTGSIEVIDGSLNLTGLTLLHNRSIAENTTVYLSEDNTENLNQIEIKGILSLLAWIYEEIKLSLTNINQQTYSTFTGTLEVKEGKIKDIGDYILRGNSLLLGADLTGKAFTKSIFGDFGQYIVAIGLLLFAFSTVIAWSYYGDRATVHLFGEGWVFWYRVIYVAAFFTASVIDTKIVWDIATVIGPIATVPNLVALILLRREIKKIDSEYVIDSK